MRYVFFQLFLACKNNLENQKWRFSSADLSTWVVLSIFMTVVRACCTSEFSFVFFLLNLTSWFTSNARMLSHVLACESSIFFFSPTSFLSKRETKWGNSDFFFILFEKVKNKECGLFNSHSTCITINHLNLIRCVSHLKFKISLYRRRLMYRRKTQ